MILKSMIVKNRSGVNIVELMLAVVFSSLVFMSVMMIDVSSRRFFKSASAQARIAADVAFVMEHMQNNLKRAYDLERPSATSVTAVIDFANTHTDDTDDIGIGYALSGTNLEYSYTFGFQPTTITTLCSDISFLEFNLVPDEHFLMITITGRYKVTGVVVEGSPKYEYVTLISGVCMRCGAGQT